MLLIKSQKLNFQMATTDALSKTLDRTKIIPE